MQSSVFLVGKLVHRQEDVRTLPSGPATSSPLVYLQDSLSSRRFLIDSGASVSVFPAPRSSSTSSGDKLLTADGSSLTCSGSRIIPLRFGTHRFEWPFQLALVAIPILGADFLKYFNLILDVSNQRVFSADSPTSPSIVLPTAPDSSSAPLKALGRLYLQKPVDWIQRSWRPPRLSSPPWRRRALFEDLTLLGLPPSTWSGRRTVAGVPVEITCD